MAERSAEGPLDLTYAALASPTRRAILEMLRGEQARVTDVARAFPASLATVSKHIQVLEHAGLVRREVRGRDHYLRAEPARLDEARQWIADYTGFWERSADALARHVEGRAASVPGDGAAKDNGQEAVP
jgi:DNA-binding transcriptional ArsR family regulator